MAASDSVQLGAAAGLVHVSAPKSAESLVGGNRIFCRLFHHELCEVMKNQVLVCFDVRLCAGRRIRMGCELVACSVCSCFSGTGSCVLHQQVLFHGGRCGVVGKAKRKEKFFRLISVFSRSKSLKSNCRRQDDLLESDWP